MAVDDVLEMLEMSLLPGEQKNLGSIPIDLNNTFAHSLTYLLADPSASNVHHVLLLVDG